MIRNGLIAYFCFWTGEGLHLALHRRWRGVYNQDITAAFDNVNHAKRSKRYVGVFLSCFVDLIASFRIIAISFRGRGRRGGGGCATELQIKKQTNTSNFYQSLITIINRDCSTVNVGTFQPSLGHFQTNSPSSFARVRRITPLLKALRSETFAKMNAVQMFHPPWNSIFARKKVKQKCTQWDTRTRYKTWRVKNRYQESQKER